MREWFGELLKQHPFRLIIGVVVALLSLGGVLRNLDTLTATFERGLNAGVVVETAKQGVVIHTTLWLFFAAATLTSSCIALALLLVRAEMQKRSFLHSLSKLETDKESALRSLSKAEMEKETALRNQDETKTKAFKTLQGMMRASSRIRDQLFPTAQQPIKSFASIENTYYIHKDFSVEVTRVSEIRAIKDPLHFYEVGISCRSDADPVEYLDDINFKVQDQSGRDDCELVYLPTLNDPRKKTVIIYFLPRVEPGDAPRRVVMTYKWPGMLNQLKKEARRGV